MAGFDFHRFKAVVLGWISEKMAKMSSDIRTSGGLSIGNTQLDPGDGDGYFSGNVAVGGKLNVADDADIDGVATFGEFPITPSAEPDADYEVANKKYVNDVAGDAPGIIKMYGGASAPSGYLLCDGSEVSRATYADLFSVIGTSFGFGDGSTTFELPDLTARFPVGMDGGDADFDHIGHIGGDKRVTLNVLEMPSHTHTQQAHNHTQQAHNHNMSTQDTDHDHNIAFNNATAAGSTEPRIATGGTYESDGPISNNRQDHRHTIWSRTAVNNAATAVNNNAGAGNSHQNLPPYLAINFIIKT
jgi:microcystin-dependent protein